MARSKAITKGGLNVDQEKFCRLYATDKEFFGNGAAAYLEIYKIDKAKPNWYRSACSAASRLLGNVKVCERINELLETQVLNDMFVDKQLGFLITQHSDFSNKLGAIREYNKLKKRIDAPQFNLTFDLAGLLRKADEYERDQFANDTPVAQITP